MNAMKLLKPLALAASISLLTTATRAENWTADFKEGNVALKSISQLAFGPEGILFLADTKSAAVVAFATGDTKPSETGHDIRIEGLSQKLAALLGTTAGNILIDDLAVNPVSHRAYLAVSRGRGPDAQCDRHPRP